MAADALTPCVARPTAAMIFTYSWNVPSLAPDEEIKAHEDAACRIIDIDNSHVEVDNYLA